MTAKDKWNYYLSRNPRGYVYLIASQSVWVPEKKQPRIVARCHVGRIDLDTLSVTPGRTFLEKFPQYVDKELFYFESKLLTKEELQSHEHYSEYLAHTVDNTEVEIAEEAVDEEQELNRNCGRSWLSWAFLQLNGIIHDLHEVFGKELGNVIAQLAVYNFCSKSQSMSGFEDWARLNYIPGLKAINGRRLSEYLAKISEADFNAFFKLRHNRALTKAKEKRDKLLVEHPHLKESKLLPALQVAFDSTSISTYSDTILNAEYGKNKQGEDLKQINLCLVADQNTEEVLYAYEYQGSVNDVASFAPILQRMHDQGFDLDETMVVTDRGYKSMANIQRLIDLDVRFVMGIPLTESSIKEKFLKYKAHLNRLENYDRTNKIYHHTPSQNDEHEKWRRNIGNSGSVDHRVFLHFYRNDEAQKEMYDILMEGAERVLKKKQAGLKCDDDEWTSFRKYIAINRKGKDKGEIVEYSLNVKEIARSAEFAGYFCLRTDCMLSAVEAIEIYRKREIIERAFRRFKHSNGNSRLLATESSYRGKLFIYLLSESLRMMLGKAARESGANLPDNSLDRYLSRIDGLIARRRGRKWRVDIVSTRQKDVFAKLGVVPPRGDLI